MNTSVLTFSIQRLHKLEKGKFLKAFADVAINDAVVIKGIRVVDGAKGMFVTMPQEQAKDGKWYETVKCLDSSIQQEISELVLTAYNTSS